jgi:predicted DNA-binding protein
MTGIGLTAELVQRLDRAAEAAGLSRAALTRQILNRALDELERAVGRTG